MISRELARFSGYSGASEGVGNELASMHGVDHSAPLAVHNRVDSPLVGNRRLYEAEV